MLRPFTLVDVPNSNTTIIWTPIFELYVIICGTKYGYQNDMSFKATELCVQNMLTIHGSMVNMIWGGGPI